MKDETVVKPRVIFGQVQKIFTYRDMKFAILEEVEQHPRLGDQDVVRTSPILSMDNEDNPKVIETMNTIYVKAD